MEKADFLLWFCLHFLWCVAIIKQQARTIVSLEKTVPSHRKDKKEDPI